MSDVEIRNAALEEAALLVEWERPVMVEEVAEFIQGWPRYERGYIPNKAAQKRAAAIRALKAVERVNHAYQEAAQ